MIRVVRLPQAAGGLEWGVQSSHYSRALYKFAKETPGTSWNPEIRAWVGYADCIALLRKKLVDAGIEVEGRVPRPTGDDGVFTMPLSLSGLREYQKEAVRFLVQTAGAGAILGDDLGLGKTVTAIRLSRAFNEKTVVICPAGLRHVWERQIQQRATKDRPEGWPEGPIFHARGVKKTTEVPPGTAVVILNYDIVYAWAETLIKWGARTLILDEAHRLQSDRSRRSKAVKAIATSCVRRVALTATPFTNRPKDLWNLVDTISPGRMGKGFPFFLRYCGAYQEQVTPTKIVWKFDRASNLPELKRRLRYFMIRRLKSEVALELPPMTRQIIEMDVKRGFKLNIGVAVQNDAQLRRALDLAADGKFDGVVDLVAGHVTEGHQVIVFTHRRLAAEHIAKGLAARGVTVSVAHGGHTQKERLRRAEARPAVLCCTMDAMGEGIDLSYADVAVFAELHWVPSTLIQCEGRAHRFGQKRNTLVQYTIARGTADELVSRAVVAKLKNFEGAIGHLDGGLRDTLEGNRKKQGAAALRALAARILGKG